MVDYELSKQLKDAGFPLMKGGELCCGENCTHHSKDEIEIPTLSELIEACGEHSLLQINHSEKGWSVSNLNKNGDIINTTGSTPEEAVAKLWLELNKK